MIVYYGYKVTTSSVLFHNSNHTTFFSQKVELLNTPSNIDLLQQYNFNFFSIKACVD